MVENQIAEKTNLWGRRDVLTLTGWTAILGALGGATMGFVRFMFPRVLFEPPTAFKAGYPDDYTVGEVSTKYKKKHRVWIIREEEGMYAILAQCTHLGCTPEWFSAEDKFKCFCHGSGFRKTGVNFEGPAPRPLERVKISLAQDGQIVIDKGVKFRRETNEWDKLGAYLKL